MATECSHGSAAELWNHAMSILRKKVNEDIYKQYFQRIVSLSVSERELKLGVNTDFFAEVIDEKFGHFSAFPNDFLTERCIGLIAQISSRIRCETTAPNTAVV